MNNSADIQYKINADVAVGEFIAVLQQSGLAERRPIDDLQCLQGMLQNSNLIVSAWRRDQLVGIARCITDFHYACYLSDLAVAQEYQHCGIGKQLQRLTQAQLGANCKLILLAAPDANAYYQKIGFENNPRCWVLQPDQRLAD